MCVRSGKSSLRACTCATELDYQYIYFLPKNCKQKHMRIYHPTYLSRKQHRQIDREAWWGCSLLRLTLQKHRPVKIHCNLFSFAQHARACPKKLEKQAPSYQYITTTTRPHTAFTQRALQQAPPELERKAQRSNSSTMSTHHEVRTTEPKSLHLTRPG